MRITIFGAGYVGLVSSACLAEVGHQVLCMDIDEAKIEALKRGLPTIFEPGLQELIVANAELGRLLFTTDTEKAVNSSELLFIAVGTPADVDGAADLQYALSVAANIGKFMENSKVIATKSTVPVGTSELIEASIQSQLDNRDSALTFSIAANPEFLKEGAAVADFMKPDRIIVGTESEKAKTVLKELYAPFNRSSDRMIYMDIRSAELTKYAANAMLATKISFINEIANLAERIGADVEQVRRGIGADPRIGHQFIYPGAGYGGSCFPKDVRALSRIARENGSDMSILDAVDNANEYQKTRLFSLIDQHFSHDIAGKVFAIWGLAFKPGTDDMREAPSRVLMAALWNAGASVRAYDPEAMPETSRLYPEQAGLELVSSREEALFGADALVICTEWQNFRAPDFDQIIASLKNPIIFDGRNLYDPSQMADMGITYYAIGRGASVNKQQ